MHLHEVACVTQLAIAGAHPEVLAQLFGRDPRTIRTVLAQAGVRPRSRAPLPADWRRGLSPETIAAIRAYVIQLQTREQVAWQQLQRVAVDITGPAYTFPTLEAYTAVLHTVHPPETLLYAAHRLGVDVNRLLLACVEALPAPR